MFLQLLPSVEIKKSKKKEIEIFSPYICLTFSDNTPLMARSIQLLSKGIEEEALVKLCKTEKELYYLYFLLEKLKSRTFLSYTADPLATLIPLDSSFILEEKEVDAETSFCLSKFCCVRQEKEKLILETPLTPTQIHLKSPEMSSLIHLLSQMANLRKLLKTFPSFSEKTLRECLKLLLSAKAICTAEENENPVYQQWEFHDLFFHSRSRIGRHKNPSGGLFPFRDKIPSLPVLKPKMFSEKIPLYTPDLESLKKTDPSFTEVLEQRASRRNHDIAPLTLEELGAFFFRSARIKKLRASADHELSFRPYPGGGAIYELEIYPLIHNCEGIAKGTYHYDPCDHALYKISPPNAAYEQLLHNAMHSTCMTTLPQVLFIITARFQRVSWKYRSIAYATMLKNLGVLIQTFYLVATSMKLSPCAIGGGDSDLFSSLTGIPYLEEASIGEFMLAGKTPN